MKKFFITISIVLTAGFLAASAYAWGCGGMYGNGYGNYNGAGYNNGAYQSFMSDTQSLRSSISADRAELNALMAGTNPDPKEAGRLSEQISPSEIEMRNKAQEYRVSGVGGMGYGRGWGCGITDHDHDFAGCW